MLPVARASLASRLALLVGAFLLVCPPAAATQLPPGFQETVPSGVAFDVAVTAFDMTSSLPVNAVILRNQTVASGQTLVGTFDFNGALACPFTEATPVTYNGAPMLPESFVTMFSIGAPL